MDTGEEPCEVCTEAMVEVRGRWIPATQEQPGEFVAYERAICEECEQRQDDGAEVVATRRASLEAELSRLERELSKRSALDPRAELERRISEIKRKRND